MRDLAGSVLADRYAFERQLGEGGMATVWLARDLRHDRLVAIKVIRPELAGAMGGDRFLREVQLTARLQHPNIVPLLDSGAVPTSDGISLPWYAMPYLAGESLRARLGRERQLAIEDALRITAAVAAALQAAHLEGVVHRDIKPENVLLAAGNCYVVDFGIAKAVSEAGGERLTSTGLSIGTPAYMSPEQGAGDAVDARTDQYSLATVLYEMLTGDVPFTASTAQAILARRLAGPARPIRPVRPSVPEPIEHAVLRALERVPADRYPDVATFVAALRAPDGSVRRVRRRRLLAVPGAGIAIVAVATLLLQVVPRRPAPDTPRDSAVVALYRRGVQSLSKRTDEGARDALASFKAALERDSLYGAAWAGLAQSYQQAVNRRFVFAGPDADSVLRLAVAALDRAVALDGPTAEVLYTQAMVARLVDPTNLAPALKALRQAASLDPQSAHVWLRLAVTLYDVGERDEAIRAWHRAIAIDPSHTEALAFLALGFMWARQYDSAAYWADSAVAVNPNYLLARQAEGNIEVERGNLQRAAGAFAAARRLSSGVELPNALAGSALVAARAGERVEAARLLAQVESLMTHYSPVPSHNAVYNAAAYAALHDTAHALAWLERYSPRQDQHFQLHIRCDPALDPIADHPRFRALLVTPRPGPGAGC
jgi:tetratricopeptide (TPR) repeat protein